MEYIEGYAFYNCELENLVIPSSMKKIQTYAFGECRELKQVVIKNGLLEIEDRVFSDCDNLISIILPDSIQKIGVGAFNKCANLSNIVFPDGLTCIDYGAFYDCDSITSIILPESVKEIGNSAFYDCDKLMYVKCSPEIIEDYAFKHCDALSTVEFGNKLKNIGNQAFMDCDKLTKISIPESVREIGYSAFYDCDKLLSVFTSAEKIGMWAFFDCNYLYEIILGDGIKNIGYNCFYNAPVEKIVIPKSINYIDDMAFNNCSALQSLALPLKNPELEEDAFYRCTNLKEVYYDGTYEDWENCIWKKMIYPDNYRIHFSNSVNVVVDGKEVEFNKYAPICENGVTYVTPEIINVFECETVTIDINLDTVQINGNKYVLDSTIKSNEVYFIPLRQLCEKLNYTVSWNSETDTVEISTY